MSFHSSSFIFLFHFSLPLSIFLFLGAAIPETSLLTLRVCTLILQIGVAEGLSLHDIGTAMSPAPSLHPSCSPSAQGSDLFSPLHQAVRSAVQVLQHKTEHTNMQHLTSTKYCHIFPLNILYCYQINSNSKYKSNGLHARIQTILCRASSKFRPSFFISSFFFPPFLTSFPSFLPS